MCRNENKNNPEEENSILLPRDSETQNNSKPKALQKLLSKTKKEKLSTMNAMKILKENSKKKALS